MNAQSCNCRNMKYEENRLHQSKINLQSLRYYQQLYINCLYRYKCFYREQLINSAMIWKIIII